MLTRSLIAPAISLAALSLLLSNAARAQDLAPATLGLDKAAGCQSLALRDANGGPWAALGCLDPTTHRFDIRPSGHILARSTSTVPTVVDLNRNPADGTYISSGPPAMSYCQVIGCNAGHSYASLLTQVTTRQNETVQEIGHAINMVSATGYTRRPPRHGDLGVDNGKTGLFVGMSARPGTGHVWGQATDLVLDRGIPAINTFAAAAEFDLSNNAFDSGIANPEGSNVYNVFVSGLIGLHPATAAVFVGPIDLGSPDITYAYHWGLGFVGDRAIKDATIVDATKAEKTLYVAGTHAQAVLHDVSTSPVSLKLSGTNAFSVISTIESTSAVALATKRGQAICLDGTTQCLAVASNMIQAASLGIRDRLVVPFGTPASSHAACVQGQVMFDASYDYHCVAANNWVRRAIGSSW